MTLVIAANYGGQWEISEAMRKLALDIEAGHLTSQQISPELIESKLATVHLPPPDLFIRTSGEQRISNFLLWQLAYSELYFTDVYWPDFTVDGLDKALLFYANRERRFGYTGDQLKVEQTMLKQRILTALVLIPIFVLLVFKLSPKLFCFFTAAILLWAAWEWSFLMGVKQLKYSFIYPALVFFLLIGSMWFYYS